MIVPTKFTSLDDSVLGKIPIIIDALDEPKSLHALYESVGNRFEDAGEFLYALDVLYLLKSIRLSAAKKIVEKC